MHRITSSSVFVALVATMLFAAAASAADAPPGEGRIAPSLRHALGDPVSPARAVDGRFAVWVRFTDKGLRGADLDAALDAAERGLGERSRRRRAKTAVGPEARLVDVTDLSLHRPYVDAVADLGAAPRRESRWLNAASFDADADVVKAIAELPFVREVSLVRRGRPLPEPSGAIPVPADPDKAAVWTLDYGSSLSELEQVNVPQVHEEGWYGQGVLIGMLDTGFSTVHEALDDVNVIAAWDFVNDDGVVDNETGDPSSARNHGTMTLSTIGGYQPGSLIGPAYGASYVLAKTEDVSTEEPFEEDNWVAGIEWLDTFGIDVASSSLGYRDWYVFDDLDGNTALCTIAADLAVGKGIVVVNSAGNDRGTSWNHIITPADGDSVITVGAVSSSGTIASFSSPGPTFDGRTKPDISARGVSNNVVSPGTTDSYTTASGTSFSCPLSAGVAALVLSRVPSLTPMQVRDALRETADRAHGPDNDYGWGILDAHAAVHWFGATIAHAELPDTEDIVGPYAVTATITDRIPLEPTALTLYWRVDGGAWQGVLLASAGGDDYTATIPGQPGGSDVEYYLEAGDSIGLVTTLPQDAPTTVFGFHVGPDLTPPVIVHQPLYDQPLLTWPPTVSAVVTDNVGVASVTLGWTLNGAPQADEPLVAVGGDAWSAPFPVDAGSLTVGDALVYTLTAVDASGQANATVDGPHAFVVIDALGVVLVIDDTGGAKAGLDLKFDADKNPVAPQKSLADGSASAVARWLSDSGYVVHEQTFAALQAADFDGVQIAALCAGGNTGPVADATARGLLRDWVLADGRTIVEGGEVGYDALSSPGYPDFAADVLHAVDWRSDSAGDLQVVAGQEGHPLVTTPNALPAILDITYGAYGDEDALDPAADAVVVMDTASYAGAAGLLAYDDTPAPQAGQIVVMAFNMAALADTVAARAMVENAAAWLLAPESPPTSAMSGYVEFAETDIAMPLEGCVVTLSTGEADTTDAAGQWSITGLYGGDYRITYTADGYATVVEDVTVADGEHLYSPYALMHPSIDTDVPWTGPASIPDNDPVGLTTTVDALAFGTISEVTLSIDLRHTWIGDLEVELTSPEGTVVRLHDRSGSSSDDIVGTWGVDLTVDGPGSLADFIGENGYGTWTLHITDNAGADTGTLESWTLHLTTWYWDTAVDGPPTARTALHTAAPNPFNPRTEIRFELARPAVPALEIFDLKGRRVRTLLGGARLPTGRHSVDWFGRHDDGREAASGVYLVRLRADGQVFERKVTLAR